MPHLLFHGPPGTGKTSCILAIAKRLYGPKNYKNMTLELNASDDRGINVVREQIKSFCSTQQLMSKGIKLVILDECDSMTSAAQFALRRSKLFCCDQSYSCGKVHQDHQVLPHLQLRLQDYPGTPVEVHSLPIRSPNLTKHAPKAKGYQFLRRNLTRRRGCLGDCED